MNSVRYNALSSINRHPPYVTDPAAGFVRDTGFGQLVNRTNDGGHDAQWINVSPGHAVTVSMEWVGFTNRTAALVVEAYDGPVSIHADGSVAVPAGTTGPLSTVTLDQTLNPGAAAAAAGIPFVDGTGDDANAVDDTGLSAFYATVWSGTPTQSVVSIVGRKADGSDPTTYAIFDNYLVRSADALPAAPRPSYVARAAVGRAGRLVALYLQDLADLPTLITAVDGSKTPVVSVNGTPVATSDPVWGSGAGQPRLTHAALRMTDAVLESDVVTVDVEDSWCTGAAGVCGAAAGIVAANGVGRSILPPFVPGPKEMEVGVNVSNPGDMYVPVSSNMARNLGDWAGDVAADFTVDEAGSIATMGSNGDISCRVAGGFNNPGDGSQTYLPSLPGVYTMGYATGAVYTLDGNGAPVTIVSGPTDDGLGTTTIAYRFGQSAPHFGPIIDLHCSVPGVLRYIHPPDPAAPTVRSVDGSSEWYSQFTGEIDGFRVLRFMDYLGTNDSNVSNFSDFTPDSTLSFSRTNNRNSVASVVRIEPYDDMTGRYAGGLGGVLILMTTAAAHGIAPGPIQNGTLAGFRGPGEAGPTYGGTFPTVSPADSVSLNGYNSILDVLTPTTFIARIRAAGGTQSALDDAYTSADFGAGATVTARNRIGGSPASAFRLCAARRIDPWVNTPTGATDACLWDAGDPTNSLFGLACTILPGTSTLWVEFGNEVWNFNFLQFTTATILGNIAGQGLQEWVTRRTAAVHALAAAAKAALGWGGTLKFVYSGFATDLGVAHANGFPVDAVAINNYWTNQPISEDFASTYAGFSHADRMDLYAFYLTNSDLARNVKAWSDATRAVYPAATVVVYEGAASSGLLFAADSGAESRWWARDPEQFHDVRYVLQMLQDNGCTLFNWFNLSGPLRDSGTTSFPAYFNCDQEAGDGSLGQNAAFDDFTTNPLSEVAGALKSFGAPTVPVTPPAVPGTVPSAGFLGRYPPGVSVPLALLTTGPGPGVVVSYRAYQAGVLAASGTLADVPDPDEPARAVGTLRLGRSFAPGACQVVYHYDDAGTAVAVAATFEVTPGGDPAGPVVAGLLLPSPEQDRALLQLGSGALAVGGDPYLDEGIDPDG